MFVHEVKRVKAERKLTHQDIATMSGVPLGTISRIMAEETDDLKFYTAVKIAVALGISIDKCAGIQTCETDTPPPPVVIPPVVDVVEPLDPKPIDTSVNYWEAQCQRERKEKGILFCALIAAVGTVLTLCAVEVVISLI